MILERTVSPVCYECTSKLTCAANPVEIIVSIMSSEIRLFY
jgi:hypothetical protein